MSSSDYSNRLGVWHALHRVAEDPAAGRGLQVMERRGARNAISREVRNTAMMDNSPERSYRRLTRSASDKKLAGVCGGIAEYFGIDPTLVRLGAVILALIGGSGLLIYLVAWILMPKA